MKKEFLNILCIFIFFGWEMGHFQPVVPATRMIAGSWHQHSMSQTGVVDPVDCGANYWSDCSALLPVGPAKAKIAA